MSNKTYQNICFLDCHNDKFHYNGECKKCNCTNEYNPVCGQDDKTYPNLCKLNCFGVKIKNQGECKKC